MRSITLALSALPFASTSFAANKTFTVVGDRLEYRNLATVESNTEFETFTGRTTKVSGSLNFDPAKRTGNGKIVVDVASLDTAIPARNEHMRGAQWLDASKYPTITFVATKVKSQRNDAYQVTGSFTMKGITKTITANAKVKYRAASEATKAAGFDGDVVQVSTTFKIKLSDYGVVIPSQAAGKVSNEVAISLSAYAVAK